MVMSRGLVISLGFSALSCTLLYLYFRNKITNIERKVDVMFDLIQNHEQQNKSPVQQMDTNFTGSNESINNMNVQDNTENWSNTAQDEQEKIIISEDDDYDDDDDSEEISDSEDESDVEDIPKLSLANTENITLSVSDVKKVTVSEVDNNNNFNDGDSLDEIDIDEDDDDGDDDGDDDDDENKNKDDDVQKENVEFKLKKVDNNDNDNQSNDDIDDEDTTEDNNDDEVDYNKLKVSELKSLAETMGLTNYKSLKKGPLVELIKSHE